MGEVLQRSAPRFLVARQNHALHERQTVFREEHVLGAAEPDTLGAELPCDLRPVDVRIGADAEFAAELVGPAHELADVVMAEFGRSICVADINAPVVPSSEMKSPSFTVTVLPSTSREELLRFVYAYPAGADDARPTHTRATTAAGSTCRQSPLKCRAPRPYRGYVGGVSFRTNSTGPPGPFRPRLQREGNPADSCSGRR